MWFKTSDRAVLDTLDTLDAQNTWQWHELDTLVTQYVLCSLSVESAVSAFTLYSVLSGLKNATGL